MKVNYGLVLAALAKREERDKEGHGHIRKLHESLVQSLTLIFFSVK